MAQKTDIEWTDNTWNPVRGCSRVSEGCRNCYAEIMAARFSGPGQWGEGLAEIVRKPDGAIDHRWTGKLVAAPEHVLLAPLKWKKPRLVFVNSTSDLFHENVPDDLIDRVFAVMALTPHITYQVLTKRPERMLKYMQRRNPNGHHPFMDQAALMAMTGAWNTPALDLRVEALPNVWLGVSIEDQATADTRIPYLLETPAAIRFVSAEPLLGGIDLESAWHGETALNLECWGDCCWCERGKPPLHNCRRGRQDNAEIQKGRSGLDWVICGGESGPGARPMHPEWARQLRDQCADAGVQFFFKQWGEWLPWQPEHAPFWWSQNGRTEDGHVLFPADIDNDPNWDDGLGYVADGMEHFAFQRVGKGKSGRLLDGVLHDGFPSVRKAA